VFFLLLLFLGAKSNFPQNISLIFPKGGETFQPGSSEQIKWTSRNVQNVGIEYSTDNGKEWNIITSSFPGFLGNYNWSIPNINSDHVIIRIYDSFNNSIADSSNLVFKIGSSFLQNNSGNNDTAKERMVKQSYLNLTYPDPASDNDIILNEGESLTITWSSSGISTIDIAYSANGGYSWSNIAKGVPASSGSYSYWLVPDVPITQGVIKISGGGISSQNKKYFYVKAPQIFKTSSSGLQKNSSFNSVQNFGNPVRILTVGNSITYDQTRSEFRFAQNKISYRYRLWDLLRSNNYNVDFIGDRSGGYGVFPDPETEGVPGINIFQTNGIFSTGYDTLLQQEVTSGPYLNSYQPDVVLIHIGTNDEFENISTVVSQVSTLINYIENYDSNHNNDIWIVLALIIQKYNSSNNPSQWVTDFNNALNTMAQNRIANGERILVVDMENALSSSDYVDGVHPDDNGKSIMAGIWYDALRTIISASAPSAPTFSSVPDTIAYANLPYRYNVNVFNNSVPPNYSLSISPVGMKINKKTGVIDWTPSSAGSVNVKVTATDPTNSFSSQQNFTIHVLPPPVLTSNLISYWRLNENVTEHSQAVFKDISGINNGSSDNSPLSVSGLVGNALSFTSSNFSNNETITVPDDSTLYFGSTSFSIETWVKTNQSAGAFLGKYVASDEMEYWLGLDGSGQAEFFARCTKPDKNTNAVSASVTFSAFPINDNNWHHIVGIVNRSTNNIYIYVDGNVNSKSVTYNSNFFSYDPLTIGSVKGGSFFNGTLDEIAIYNKALSGSEVLDHYNRGITYAEGYFDITAKIKVFLQGPYAGSGTMNTTLNTKGLIPLSQPYNVSPWNYYGDENVSSIPPGVVDWILVELRTGTASSTLISRRAAFLKSNGSVVDLDGTSPLDFFGVPAGSYYIVVRHRNHLAVMSANTVTLPNSSEYIFTNSNTYGTNAMDDLGGGNYGMWAGDANRDSHITTLDFNLWLPDARSAKTGYNYTDINLDGQDTTLDFNLWLPNARAAKSSQVP
jgi:lysophospholipase L1-like esterase